MKKFIILTIILSLIGIQSFARVKDGGIINNEGKIVIGEGAGFVTAITKSDNIITLKTKAYGPFYNCTGVQVAIKFNGDKVEMLDNQGQPAIEYANFGGNDAVKFLMEKSDQKDFFSQTIISGEDSYAAFGVMINVYDGKNYVDFPKEGLDFAEIKFRLKEGSGSDAKDLKSLFDVSDRSEINTWAAIENEFILASGYSDGELFAPSLFNWDYSFLSGEPNDNDITPVISEPGWKGRIVLPEKILYSGNTQIKENLRFYTYNTNTFDLISLSRSFSVEFRASSPKVFFDYKNENTLIHCAVMKIDSDAEGSEFTVYADIYSGGILLKTVEKKVQLVKPVNFENITVSKGTLENKGGIYKLTGLSENDIITILPKADTEEAFFTVYQNDEKLKGMDVTVKKGYNSITVCVANDASKQYTDIIKINAEAE